MTRPRQLSKEIDGMNYSRLPSDPEGGEPVYDSGFVCEDCGVSTDEIHEYYMVHDALWLSCNAGFLDGMLCVGCLEVRMGRTLVQSDFTDAPVNRGVFRQSERLKNRLDSLCWRYI